MARVPFRVSNVAERLKHRRIHAMHFVHSNRTGQPWDKPGHDGTEKVALLISTPASRSAAPAPQRDLRPRADALDHLGGRKRAEPAGILETHATHEAKHE